MVYRENKRSVRKIILRQLLKKNIWWVFLITSASVVVILATQPWVSEFFIQTSYLPSQVGRTEGNSRVAEEGKDLPGVLIYGPYVSLSPGIYNITLKYSASTDLSATWDIIFMGASNRIKEGHLFFANQGLLNENITVNKEDNAKKLEIRVFYSGRGNIKVDEIIIKKIDNFGKKIFSLLGGGIGSALLYIFILYLYAVPLNNVYVKPNVINKLEKIWIFSFILIAIYITCTIFKFWDTKLFTIKATFFGSLCFPFISAKYLFKKSDDIIHTTTIETKIKGFLLFPLFFNLTLLIVAYFSSLGTGIRAPFFRIGSNFDNFPDFYWVSYMVILNGQQGIHALLAPNSYWPFSILISNLFGMFLDWDENYVIFNTKAFMIYIFYFILCMSSLFLMIQEKIINCIDKKNRLFFGYIFILIIITSYPFIFAFERGNYVLVSLFFLALALNYYDKSKTKSALFLGLFMGAKILNLIFLPFLFVHYRRRHIFLCLSLFIAIQFFALNFLLKSIDYGYFPTFFINILAAPISSNISINDGQKVFGYASIDAMRAAVYLMYNNIIVDINSENFYFTLIQLIIGLFTLILYYVRANKRIDYIDHGLLLVIIPILFHPLSADYSLVLIFPLIILFFIKEWQPLDSYIMKFVLATLIIMNMLPFHLVYCFGSIELGRLVGVSIKNFVLPIVYAIIIFLIIKKQSITRKEHDNIYSEWKLTPYPSSNEG